MAQIERELKTKLVAALASIAVETPNEAEMELADAIMTIIVERSDSNAFRVAWLYIQNRGEQAFKVRVE